jgi:osmotically-inducible protein OsmY
MGNQFDDERQRRDWAYDERQRREWHQEQADDRDRGHGQQYAGQPQYSGMSGPGPRGSNQYPSGPYAHQGGRHDERGDERPDERDWRRSSRGLAREREWNREWNRNFEGRDPRYDEARFGARDPAWNDYRDQEAMRLDRFGRSPDRWPYDPSSADWRQRQEWQGGDFRSRDPFEGRQGYDPRHYGSRSDEPRMWTDIKRGARRLFRGLKGYTRPDDRIREDVCDRINDAGERMDADVSDVEVRVQNGEVTLSGVIRDRRQKHVVENAADSVGGVKDVHNLLRVRRDDEAGEVVSRPENGPQGAGRGVTGSNVNRTGSA